MMAIEWICFLGCFTAVLAIGFWDGLATVEVLTLEAETDPQLLAAIARH